MLSTPSCLDITKLLGYTPSLGEEVKSGITECPKVKILFNRKNPEDLKGLNCSILLCRFESLNDLI